MTPGEVFYEKVNEIAFPRRDAYGFTEISNGITAKYGFCDWKVYDSAHPNIKFKGDDENTKDTQAMIEYVTKKPIDIISNFYWEKELQDLINEKENKNKKNTKKEKDQKEYEFC